MYTDRLKSVDPRELFVFIAEEPLMAHYLLRSKIIEDEEFPGVAAVCIKKGLIHLYLNPTKMNEFTTKEKLGVLIHEYLHVLFLHCTKRGKEDPEKRRLENIAMDMSINQLIVSSFALPKVAVFHNKGQFNFPSDLTSEQYFELLEKMAESQDVGGDSLDNHDSWDEGDQLEGRSVIKEIAESYAEGKNAQNMGKTLAGSKHGDLLEKILSIETNDIAWQNEVKRFMHNVKDIKRKGTWKRFSRRYGFPNQGRKHKNIAKVAAIVDTSGSMDQTFLSHIGGQLNLMTRFMQVDIFFVDAALQGEIKKFKPSKELEYPGRGGTDMQPGFDRAFEDGYRGVVCFTDGHLYSTVSSQLPTLWVVVNNNGFTAPFGAVAHVEWKG